LLTFNPIPEISGWMDIKDPEPEILLTFDPIPEILGWTDNKEPYPLFCITALCPIPEIRGPPTLKSSPKSSPNSPEKVKFPDPKMLVSIDLPEIEDGVEISEPDPEILLLFVPIPKIQQSLLHRHYPCRCLPLFLQKP
jgi:hypothetical protein